MSEKFENKVKDLLDDLQFEPRENVWANLHDALHPEKKRRRFAFWWLLPVALAGGALVYTLNNGGGNQVLNQHSEATTNSTTNTTTSKDNNTTVTGSSEKQSAIPAPATNGVKEEISVPEKQLATVVTRKRANVGANTVFKPRKARVIANENQPKTVVTVPVKKAPGQLVTEQKTEQPTKEAEQAELAALVDPTPMIAKAEPPKTDSLAVAGKAPVVEVKKNKRWQWGVAAEFGLANLSQGLDFGMEKDMLTASPSTGSGGFGSVVYQRTSYNSRFLWGLGITAKRKLNEKVDFRASLGYQYRSFATTTSNYKDTVIAGAFTSLPLQVTQNAYRFQVLSLNTQLSYFVLRQKDFGFAIGAGIENQFLLQAKNSNRVYMPGGSLQSESLKSATSAYHRWQPQLDLHLSAEFGLKSGKSIQLNPYLRHGFRGLQKTAQPGKNQLVSYGLGLNYFFR